jgi:hypothetical protein
MKKSLWNQERKMERVKKIKPEIILRHAKLG